MLVRNGVAGMCGIDLRGEEVRDVGAAQAKKTSAAYRNMGSW
ncbi:MAG TPA: hypothetical protein VL463_14325 [Kofleriaceae bacterium]|nr:hypothetical protein [Kofleriaceae bacterium]